MKIKNIKIKNFRCYYGEKNIKFSLDGKITFIFGLSGAGKTTFIDFINWMFYNKMTFADIGKKDMHKIYNDKLEDETTIGQTFDVQGIVEFIHNNIDYQLVKKITFEKTIRGIAELSSEKEQILNYYSEGSWIEYRGNINDKINEIIPQSLSRYFFFHGEKLDLINAPVRGAESVRNSVYKLFGLKEYENAITHIGNKSTSQTVIHQYHLKKANKIKNLTEAKPEIILSKLSKYEEAKQQKEREAKKYKLKIEEFEHIKQKLVSEIGVAQSSDVFENTIKTNERLIKEYEKQIKETMVKIGNCFYKSTPYLILSELTKKSVIVLSQEAKENDNKFLVFKNLKKELLKEIIDNDQCICGHVLDEKMRDYIQTTIDNMPPDSYVYQLKQFGSNAKDYIEKSYDEYLEYDEFIRKIISLKNDILDINEKNRLAKEELKKSENTKELYQKLSETESSIKRYVGLEANARKDASDYDKYVKRYELEYEKAAQAVHIQNEFDLKIEMLEEIKRKLEDLLDKKIKETKKILEENILEIYGIISTRFEDFSNKKFLKDDFSLRDDSLTGGQATIDVYAYIVGMVKALQKADVGSSDKEFPIIVDAPFSHCDPEQSNRVFNVLPTIVPQVIMLTFATDIKNSLNEEKVGNCYILKSNEEQTMTDIIPSNIADIKALIEEKLVKGGKNVNKW